MTSDAYSYLQLILAAMGAAGGIIGFVKLLSFSVALWDKRRKSRLSEAVEVKRLATEAKHLDDEMMERALWRLLDERKQEIVELKTEIAVLEQSQSLAGPRRVKIYESLGRIRQQINIVSDTVRETEMPHTEKDALNNEIDILRGRVGELEQILP